VAGVLDAFKARELLGGINLFREVFRAEVREAGECEYSLILPWLLGIFVHGYLNDLLFFNDINLCLEETTAIDDLTVLDDDGLCLWLAISNRLNVLIKDRKLF
jgi:hypothetical protein